MGDLVIALLMTISAFLDILISWVIEQAYNLLMLIADTNIFGEEALGMFSKRIYVLLGVFMLFKLSFSLVTFLIEPDEFYSKEKGGKKLVTNVVIVLLLIVSAPTLFEQMYKLQGLLLKNHVVDQVILGVPQPKETNSDGENGSNSNFSRGLSFSIFSSFYMPNPEVSAMNADCRNMYDGSPIDNCLATVGRIAGPEGQVDLADAFEQRKVSKLFAHSLLLAKEDGKYIFDYKFFISTITGGIVAVILIGFCIDVAVRAVKLGFLQLIAPIPIISFIDPKSSKSGIFKNWVTNVLKTFMDLFIRLAALFFAVFIISLLANNEMKSISGGETLKFTEHPFVKIFVILGALLFAKQIPGLISDITGIKFDTGGFSINPMNKLGASPLAAAAVGTVAGGIGGVASNAIAQFANRKNIAEELKDPNASNFDRFKTITRTVGSPFVGGMSSATRGFRGGLSSDGKGSALAPAQKAISESNQARNRRATIRDLNEANPDNKIDFATRNIYEPVRQWAGVQNKDGGYGKLDKRSKGLSVEIANLDQQEDAYRREYSKVTSSGLTTGIYNLNDYDYASKGITEKHTVNGQEVEKTIYDFDKYKERVEFENQTRHETDKIEILDRKTYTEVTGLSRAIHEIDERRETLRKQQGRIDKGIKQPGDKK